MKQKRRYRRKTKGDGLVSSWPEECDEPEQLAQRVAYVGSAEHKARPVDPSFRIEPDLRSDASKCPTDIDRDNAKRVLREALQRRCVSQSFESGFPRYAWG